MKSIEKLREFVDDQFVISGQAYLQGMAIANSIEAEIAANYLELPEDADGVPIHMDDMLKSENASKPFIVESMTFADSWTVWDRENGATRWPSECHHVKERTIEDVLREFGDWYKHVAGGCDEPGIIAKYADELRGMGVGE